MLNRLLTHVLLCCLCWSFVFWPVQAKAFGEFSIGDERKVGQQLLYSIRAEFPLLDDPDLSQYISKLGREILSVAGIQHFDYHFFVVESPQFNAFAAPGGLIFFYTGLIEAMVNENELVSVLAHEIGHVASRHIADRMAKSGKIGLATMLVGAASLALGNPALLLGTLAASQTASLHYSRNDEEQADRLSFEWMQALKRNPVAMKGMLRTMRRITRYRSGEIPQYLLTHPNPEFRLGYVDTLVAMDPHQQEHAYYSTLSNFDFLRFKYRVMIQQEDLEKLRVLCINYITANRDPEQVIMAEYGLALLAAEERRFEQALAGLHKVQTLYPDKSIVSVDLATVYMRMRQPEKARSLLRPYRQEHPEDLYGLYQLALVEQSLGNLEEAKQLLETLSFALPEFSKIYYELGRMASQEGQPELSAFYLAQYYLYQGKIPLAKRALQQAAENKNGKLSEKHSAEAQALLDKLKALENDE